MINHKSRNMRDKLQAASDNEGSQAVHTSGNPILTHFKPFSLFLLINYHILITSSPWYNILSTYIFTKIWRNCYYESITKFITDVPSHIRLDARTPPISMITYDMESGLERKRSIQGFVSACNNITGSPPTFPTENGDCS